MLVIMLSLVSIDVLYPIYMHFIASGGKFDNMIFFPFYVEI